MIAQINSGDGRNALRKFALALCVAALGLARPIAAQEARQAEAAGANAAAPAELAGRASELVAVLRGEIALDAFFAPFFLDAVPPAEIEAIRADIVAQYGPPRSVERILLEDAQSGVVEVDFGEAVGRFRLVIAEAEPHQVVGLLFTGFTLRADSYAKVKADFADLPGDAGYAVSLIGPGGARAISGLNDRRQFAIGSTFKLYVLAELVAAIREGRTEWDAVVPLGRPSVPSGISQDWPMGAPVTMATLATLMIGISDNTATDTLVGQLGRDRIGARLVEIGHAEPARTLPLLDTLALFALKMEANAAARETFLSLPEAEQAAYLETFAAGLDRGDIRDVELAGAPKHIDTVEWFASPADLVRLLNYLRRVGDPLALDILAVNQGVGANAAGRWDYLGYKGGSETGVLNMSFLGRRADGQWVAITGSWNNSEAALDKARFAALMTRLLDLTVE